MTTVARGLVTIKHFKKSFSDFLTNSRFSGVIRNGVETTTGKKANDFASESRKAIQSAEDQIQSDFKLRCAINKANHENTVVVGTKEMSISDALTYRTHTLPLVVQLRQRLATSLKSAQDDFQRKDAEYQDKLKNATSEAMKALLEDTDRPTIVDLKSKISELDLEINFFKLEFDAVLTEKNPMISVSE